jgi:hypothetical protein
MFRLCALLLLLGLAIATPALTQAATPRFVRISGQRFIDVSNNNVSIVLGGPNVVVKGPPYMPAVSGDKICNDMVNDTCSKSGTCTSCFTFNQADST